MNENTVAKTPIDPPSKGRRKTTTVELPLRPSTEEIGAGEAPAGAEIPRIKPSPATISCYFPDQETVDELESIVRDTHGSKVSRVINQLVLAFNAAARKDREKRVVDVNVTVYI